MTIHDSDRLLPEYAEWLSRVRMIREAVAYCCFHRLQRDAALAERVSVEVVAGLLARPKIFQYYGLPFSGRVAHLTEMAIARVAEDKPGGTCTWPMLEEALIAVPPPQQAVVVQLCVEGCDDAGLATALGCEESEARRRREEALARLERSSALVLPVNAHRSRRVQSVPASRPPPANARVTRSDP